MARSMNNSIFKCYQNLNAPLMIAIDFTNKCNYRCRHCYNNSGKGIENELNDEELEDVVRQAVDLRPISMCFCGGEPTLRKNYLDLIKIGVSKGSEVNMVSNGSNFNLDILKEIKASGLGTLQISLDGANSMQHDTLRGVPGAFEKAIESIKNAKNANLRVMTALTPNKMNINSIDQYVKLCFDLGVDEVRIMPLIPMGRGSEMDFLLLNANDYYLLQLNILKAKEYYEPLGMKIEWGDPLDHYMRFVKNGKDNIPTMQMEVKANGNLTISTYIPIVVGNVRLHPLREYWDKGYNSIWANSKVVNYVENIKNIYDINNLDPKPYSGEYYNIPIIA